MRLLHIQEKKLTLAAICTSVSMHLVKKIDTQIRYRSGPVAIKHPHIGRPYRQGL